MALDFIDLDTGRVVERVDQLKSNVHGWWTGFRGDEDLALLQKTGTGAPPELAFSSPR